MVQKSLQGSHEQSTKSYQQMLLCSLTSRVASSSALCREAASYRFSGPGCGSCALAVPLRLAVADGGSLFLFFLLPVSHSISVYFRSSKPWPSPSPHSKRCVLLCSMLAVTQWPSLCTRLQAGNWASEFSEGKRIICFSHFAQSMMCHCIIPATQQAPAFQGV